MVGRVAQGGWDLGGLFLPPGGGPDHPKPSF